MGGLQRLNIKYVENLEMRLVDPILLNASYCGTTQWNPEGF